MFKSLYERWAIYNADNKPTSCILALPGRGNRGQDIAEWYSFAGLKKTLIVAVTPANYEWYPQPNGPQDQADAVAGQEAARNSLEWVVDTIEKRYGIKSNRMALVGFSAGAVMAIQTAIHSEREFAAVIGHGGAILDPGGVPPAKNAMPIYLMHSNNDSTFEWDERFVPMKESLEQNGYNVESLIRKYEGHRVIYEDIVVAGAKLAPALGYPKGYQTVEYPELLERSLRHVKVL